MRRPAADGALRVGVVGVGAMGRNHARILAELPGTELVGIADRDEPACHKVATALGTRAFLDHDALIAARVDAVVVAVPTRLHHATASALIDNGIHVLIEKPITSTLTEAEDLMRRAARAGVVLMVGHVERFNPTVQAVRDGLDPNEMISISITRVGPFPPRVADVGIVIDLGVHDIDLIRWLTQSEIVEHQVLKSHTRGGHEDIAYMQFRTASGVLAHVNTNWLTPFKERKLSIATPRRFIVGDLLFRTAVEFSDYRTDGSFTTRHLSVPSGEPLRAELAAFAAAVRGDGPVPVTGEDGMRCLKVALDCLGP